LEDAEDVLGTRRERARIDGDVRPVAVTYRHADRWRNHDDVNDDDDDTLKARAK
jgi:hypothetical protein